jgi:glycosyltransferase involved in cell wall biosynthesis
MRLGIHYHLPARAGSDGISLPYFYGCFIDSLAPHYSQIVLFSHGPTKAEESELGYCLKAKNVKVINLGRRLPVYVRLVLAPYYKFLFRKNAHNVDIMMFRVSTVLLPFVAKYFKNRFLYFVSHSSEGLDALRQPAHRMILIKLWTHYYARREMQIARQSKVLTNSLLLQQHLKKELGRDIVHIASTTLYKADIQRPSLKPLKDKIRLLFVGRVSYLKGIADIVDALGIVRRRGLDIELTVVGEFGNEGDFKTDLKTSIQKQGLSEHVHFAGFVSGGESLWEIYRESDIFVIASRESEGAPRVIWEAMSQSLPVVSTRIGSIPQMAPGAIELVEPKNADSIAQGIERVARDEAYRAELIEKGFHAVSENTLENRAEQLSQWISTNFTL